MNLKIVKKKKSHLFKAISYLTWCRLYWKLMFGYVVWLTSWYSHMLSDWQVDIQVCYLTDKSSFGYVVWLASSVSVSDFVAILPQLIFRSCAGGSNVTLPSVLEVVIHLYIPLLANFSIATYLYMCQARKYFYQGHHWKQ